MDFGIFSPKLGKRKDTPSVILGPSFLTDRTENIHQVEGLYKRLPGRLAHIYDADGVKIACPKYIYAVTAVDQGNKKFTISGDHASEVPSTVPAATALPVATMAAMPTTEAAGLPSTLRSLGWEYVIGLPSTE